MHKRGRVFAEGAATESLYTGPETLKMLRTGTRAEIYQIFPQLRDAQPHYAPNPARPILSRQESKSHIFLALSLADCALPPKFGRCYAPRLTRL